MLINLSELFSREGKVKTYTLDIEMAQFHAPDGAYEVVDKEPIKIRVENVGERTLDVTGNVKLTLRIPCDRCLDPVDYRFDFDIHIALDMKKSEEDRVEELDEQSYLDGYNLDVDRMVANELLVNLPMKVLCREDCKGICNQCGANLNRGNCECEHTSLDPRMSVIQDIFKQSKEV